LSHPKLVGALLAWLPIKLGLLRSPQVIPRPDTLADVLIDEGDLPEPARAAILGPVSEAVSLGFEDPIFECARSEGMPIAGVSARGYHPTGHYIFQFVFLLAADGQTLVEQHFVSFFGDGATLASSNGRPRFDRPPTAEAYYHPGLPIPALLASHEDRLASRPGPPILVNTRAALIREVDAMMDRFFEYMLARGLYEEVPEMAESGRRVRRRTCHDPDAD
jgi:hypothetical protein